jgi:hypothetical protein
MIEELSSVVLTKWSSQLPAASLQRRKIRALADSFGDQRLTIG